MKVDKETVVFKVLTGSRLYGTDTPQSDFDYKAVTLPALTDLLLNRRQANRKEKPVGIKAGDRMVAGEAETEYMPIQVFLDDFFSGQTYALEVAFAASQGLHTAANTQDHEFWKDVMTTLVDRFTVRNVKKMVGYAVGQSKVYGLKTERYTSMVETLRTINAFGQANVHDNESRANLTLGQLPELVEKLTALPHVLCTTLLINSDTETVPGIDICGKKFPFTNKVVTVVKSLEKSVDNYGDRVKEFEGEGVDWKALSHAIRITEQVVELCDTGKLVFPRPSAAYLLDVKSGRVPLQAATDYLNANFAGVDDAVSRSVLRERTPELEEEFHKWKLELLVSLYRP